MKKLLAITFALVLCFALGVVAMAEETYTLVLYRGELYQGEYSTTVDNTDFTNLTKATVTGITGNTAAVNGVYKYTFNGVNFETSSNAAIKILDSKAEIVLENSNTVKGGNSNPGTYGIWFVAFNGDAVISGSGSLTVTAGNSFSSYSYGIRSGSNIKFSGCTVTAKGGEAYIASNCDSYGIYVNAGEEKGTLTVSDGAKVTAESKAAKTSYGILSSADVIISGSTVEVTAAGKSAEKDITVSCGICSNYSSITISDSTVTAKGNKAEMSYGLYASQNIEISESTVTAEATGDIEATSGQSCGIYAKNGYITVSGGTVNANGSYARVYSYGLHASKKITVSGTAKVTAAGQNAYWDGFGMDTNNFIYDFSGLKEGGFIKAEGKTRAIARGFETEVYLPTSYKYKTSEDGEFTESSVAHYEHSNDYEYLEIHSNVAVVQPTPDPAPKPEPCDHKLDENGKCSRCGVIIITYTEGKAEVSEEETNPNTGAPVLGLAALLGAIAR